MKIKISDSEVYEIKNIYEEFTLAELTDLIERLNNAFPSSKITTFSSGKTTIIQPYVPTIRGHYNKQLPKENREQAIEIVKKYYFNHNKTKVSKYKVKELRSKFNIQPQEVGLREIPHGRWADIKKYQLNPNETISVSISNSEITKRGTIRRNKRRNFPFTKDRNESIRVLKLHYFGTKEEKENYVKQSGTDRNWNDMVKNFHQIRIKWNIQPQEVGIERFPSKGEYGLGKGKRNSEKPIEQQSEKPRDELLEEVQYY